MTCMNQTSDSHNNKPANRLPSSFAAAWSGLAHTMRTQRNMRIHMAVALMVAGLGGVLRIASWEWCTLVLTVSGVVCLELMNTALEATVDLVTLESRPLARSAKDAAAAAVLVMAGASVVIGLVIFLPRMILLMGGR
jgi:diacylglycerol kinase